MKVIVAGLPKTGTKTMTGTLTLLGYNVYDRLENFYYLGDDWKRQIQNGFKKEDMRRMYENVDAVADDPCNYYWEEIFDAFPDTKVILTTRDDDSWYRSFVKQIDQLNNDIPFRLVKTFTITGIRMHFYMATIIRHFGNMSWPRMFIKLHNEETLKRNKRRHERSVKQVVPKTRLLVYEVKEGWKPLCDFLGVAVPNMPFPHKNKGATVLHDLRKENPVMRRIQNELIWGPPVLYFSICAISSNSKSDI